jgi:hypothetical protein
VCVLSPWWGSGVILCSYVNDILIFGTSLDVINEVKTFLCQSFDMKDLGEANVILNIKLIKGENDRVEVPDLSVSGDTLDLRK